MPEDSYIQLRKLELSRIAQIIRDKKHELRNKQHQLDSLQQEHNQLQAEIYYLHSQADSISRQINEFI